MGGAIARQLSAGGFKIALLYFGSAESDVEKNIDSLNGQGHKAYRCDITDEEEVNNITEKIAKDFGGIDICVHAAASKLNRVFLNDLSSGEFRRQFEVGVFGGFNFISACARLMEKNKGIIVGITSAAIEQNSSPGKMGAYLPAKHALHGLLCVMRDELNRRGIKVYEIAPGFLPGGLNKDLPAEISEFLSKKNNPKYPSSAEKVAEAVALLCSEN